MKNTITMTNEEIQEAMIEKNHNKKLESINLEYLQGALAIYQEANTEGVEEGNVEWIEYTQELIDNYQQQIELTEKMIKLLDQQLITYSFILAGRKVKNV